MGTEEKSEKTDAFRQMQNEILVSVIIVSYNSEDTIKDTLESVFSQTYRNIELLISDDCSTDRTIDVVKKWCRHHKERFVRIRIIKGHKNHGVTENCNIGINEAQGKYVQIIAGDDVLFPDAVERRLFYSEQNPGKIVISKMEVFGNNRAAVEKFKKYQYKAEYLLRNNYDYIRKDIARTNWILAPEAAFFSKHFLVNRGLFDTHYKMMEDYPFYYHFILDGGEFYPVDDVLIKYRVSESSLSGGGHPNPKLVKTAFYFFIRERMWKLIQNGEVKEAKNQLLKNLSELLTVIKNSKKS